MLTENDCFIPKKESRELSNAGLFSVAAEKRGREDGKERKRKEKEKSYYKYLDIDI